MLDLKVLGSSSKGNCYIVSTSKEVLMLEAGVNYKQIAKALNFDFDNVAGCLVTHEHKDHSKSMEDLAKHGIDVFTSAGTVLGCKIEHHRIKIIEAEKQFKVGSFTVLPFETEHDCKEPLGFLVYHKEFGKLLFATDTYYIKYKFKDLNYIMVECNYSKEMLDRAVKLGVTSGFVKKRLLASHFSLENVKKFLKANDLSGVREIRLLHLSDNNSDEKLFKNEIEKLTGIPTLVC